jgi:putative membrane protein
MADLPRLLLGSLLLRPYVYGFLILHLAGASALLGWRRTTALTLIAWLVAFVAEASSIRTGIPFGWYYYLPQTADQELWIAGVPFFDSLSFPFLLTASYGLAWLLLGKPVDAEPGARRRPSRWPHALLAVGLFVLLDVVIDPVALRGDRWFLGQIYGYPEPGVYFGIPLANFLGWGIVGLAATGLVHAWEGREIDWRPARFAGRAWLCPGLYFTVLAFNLAVTFAIGEWTLGLTGIAVTLPVLAWTAITFRDPGTTVRRAREERVSIS